MLKISDLLETSCCIAQTRRI